MATLDEVYRKFGEVSEAAQLLETELGNFLLCVHGAEHDLFCGDKPELATEILEKINRSTLGQVLKQVGSSAKFPVPLDRLFADALAERNRLAHHFYREHNFRRNTDEGRAKMIEDLETMHETILKAYQAALALSGIDLHKSVVPLPTKHQRI